LLEVRVLLPVVTGNYRLLPVRNVPENVPALSQEREHLSKISRYVDAPILFGAMIFLRSFQVMCKKPIFLLATLLLYPSISSATFSEACSAAVRSLLVRVKGEEYVYQRDLRTYASQLADVALGVTKEAPLGSDPRFKKFESGGASRSEEYALRDAANAYLKRKYPNKFQGNPAIRAALDGNPIEEIFVLTHEEGDMQGQSVASSFAENPHLKSIPSILLVTDTFKSDPALRGMVSAIRWSNWGEVPAKINANRIHFAGGNVTGCLGRSMRDSVTSSLLGNREQVSIYIHTKLIYGAGSRIIREALSEPATRTQENHDFILTMADKIFDKTEMRLQRTSENVRYITADNVIELTYERSDHKQVVVRFVYP
jgi:hypothetical protein